MDEEKQFKVIGEPGEGMQSYWASCCSCPNEICVYHLIGDAGQREAEQIMEDQEGWWYVDGTWLCPVCQ